MSKRRWQDILVELHRNAHDDGYFGRKSNIEGIVDELIAEMEYANLAEIPHLEQGFYGRSPHTCKLPSDPNPTGDSNE